MTISQKLTWLTALVSAAALALACAAFLAYDQVTFRDNLIANVLSQADVVGLNSVSALVFNDPDAARSSITALAHSHNVLAATVFSADGTPFATYQREVRYRVSEPLAIPPDQDVTSHVIGNQAMVARKIVFNGKQLGTIVVRGDLSDLRRRLIQYVRISIIVLAMSLMLALALSSAFRRAVAAPIVQLADTARVVSRQKDYSVRARETKTRDEVGLLVRAFNDMLQQIHLREQELETERARLGAIIESAPFGIIVAEASSGKLIIASKLSEEVLGLSLGPDAHKQLHANEALRSSDDVALREEEYPIVRVLSGEVVRAEELRYRRPDGTDTWLRVYGSPVRDKNGTISAAVLAFSDIGATKRAHQALMQSEKLAAAGRLAASIAHEINNPLESVTNLLFLALADGTVGEATRTYLTQADQELARVSQIATQTLRFYRQSTKPTLAKMSDLVDAVLHLLRGRIANAHIEVVKEYRTDRTIVCFESELRQVFTNVISNAIDAMHGINAQLVIRVAERRNWKTGERGIGVSICDSGHGIPADVLARVFEPFYSTKGNLGTGLGLWVSKGIVEKHRGSVYVRSRVHVGTTFSVFLPFNAIAVRIAAV